jgi:hypothetical protein
VKLIESSKEKWLFHLGRREKQLLLDLLRFYPCIPPAHHRVTKTAQLEPSTQQLLDEALAEHRAGNKRLINAFISTPARWAEHQSGWRLSLSAEELEWLLQVLNDIRVGSWIAIGSPETDLGDLTEKTAPHLWAMEISGSFQIALMRAFEHED